MKKKEYKKPKLFNLIKQEYKPINEKQLYAVEKRYSRDKIYNKTKVVNRNQLHLMIRESVHLFDEKESTKALNNLIEQLEKEGKATLYLTTIWRHPDDAHFDGTQSLTLYVTKN